jgi:two-component system, cell cycle response regulator DivK
MKPGSRRTRGGAHVLIVDDVEDNRALYVEYFRHRGVATDDACDGVEALRKARATHPQVIVMDISMPGLDGFEATRLLKEDEATRDIVVVALTGHGEGHYREQAAKVGVDLFITKPCLPSDLWVHVQQCLGGRP